MKSCSRPWCCASQTPCTRTEPVSDRRPVQTARAQSTSIRGIARRTPRPSTCADSRVRHCDNAGTPRTTPCVSPPRPVQQRQHHQRDQKSEYGIHHAPIPPSAGHDLVIRGLCDHRRDQQPQPVPPHVTGVPPVLARIVVLVTPVIARGRRGDAYRAIGFAVQR